MYGRSFDLQEAHFQPCFNSNRRMLEKEPVVFWGIEVITDDLFIQIQDLSLYNTTAGQRQQILHNGGSLHPGIPDGLYRLPHGVVLGEFHEEQIGVAYDP